MQRPVSVTVFGVINILFGVFGLLSNLMLTVMRFAPHLLMLQGQGLMAESPHAVVNIWTQTLLIAGIFVSMGLIAAGIGLFFLHPSARKASIGYSIYAILTAAGGMLISVIYVALPTLQTADTHNVPGGQATLIGGMIGGLLGATCFNLVHPVLLWYFMMRPNVMAAFGGVTAAPLIEPRRRVVTSDNPYASPDSEVLSAAVVGEQPTSGVEGVVETLIPSGNGPALAAYYLGLFSLFPCLGFPLGVAAVVFGQRGLRNVRENPAVSGGVHAWIGIICGSIFGLFNFALAVLMVIGLIAIATGKK